MFDNDSQFRDWQQLNQAIDKAPVAIPCVSFPDAYWPEKDWISEINGAKKMCRDCPVMTDCLLYALKWEDEGIWGGMSAVERRKIKRDRKALSA
jgi:hypothetical protein